MIDPRSLKTYLTVCREKSISGAARRLNISQPAVSVTVAQLELAVNAKLFERSRTGIVLTAAGSALLQRAQSMEALLRDAEQEIALTKAGVRGPLRIGGTPGALVSLVPNAVNHMVKHHGRFSLHIVERPDHVLLDLLRTGQIEVAVVTTGIGALPEDIEEKAIARDPFALIVGKRNKHLPSEMALSETRELLWVLPEAEGAFRRQVDALFVVAKIPTPRNAVQCDSLLTTKAIVREGEYITILPRRVAAAELAIGTLRAIRIKKSGIEREVGIRMLTGHEPSDLAKLLIAALQIHGPRYESGGAV